MAGNSFGQLFKISSFGESHGPAIGGMIDGCPAGVIFDMDFLRLQMSRRKPGQSEISTPRAEDDEVEILSGVFNGKTTGSPIGFIIRNKDQHSKDYDQLKEVFRPGHADQTWTEKFGFRDYRGGGRASARETAVRVAGGAIAQMFLKQISEIKIQAYVSQIHDISLDKSYSELDLNEAEKNAVRCPDPSIAQKMIDCIAQKKEEGNSVGGMITCIISGVPIGIGEPVFDKLPALLAHAMMSINATKGFEIGDGFRSAQKTGSESNDAWTKKDGAAIPASNHAGGVAGGISNGQDIYFNVAFKPASSIARSQDALNRDGDVTSLEIEGRHDPCVVPRAVPIVEAMSALVLADLLLIRRTNKI
jgi:chorismate synthase